MKFGETFTEYLHGDQESVVEKFSHIEYKRLKKVLKICRTSSSECQCESCHCRDQIFSELMREASNISGCFSSRARHLFHLHIATGMQRYILYLRHCFKNDEQELVKRGEMLVEYVAMNAIAIRKILKKYDKVHNSVNGKNFRSKLQAEHIELLQSPWLIELGAFCLNFNRSLCGDNSKFLTQLSVDVDETPPTMTLMLPDSVKLDYDLTCAICLDILFKPVALTCGHRFCKSCACSAASVMILEGLKVASQNSKCPICRETGVYGKSVEMVEVDLLLKRRCKDSWKERLTAERAMIVKQSKDYWDSQARFAIGYE